MAFDAESDECELTGQEDPVVLYMVIENSPLQHAFKEGITKKKTYRRNLIHLKRYHTLILYVCMCVWLI